HALREFVVDLVHADGGELYLVQATADDVHVHLTGTCAGCPGSTMTRERLLEPAVRGVAPKATIKMTTGCRGAEGGQKTEARGAAGDASSAGAEKPRRPSRRSRPCATSSSAAASGPAWRWRRAPHSGRRGRPSSRPRPKGRWRWDRPACS